MQLAEAREALATDARARAVRAAGRALALDPSSTEAAELVSHLVLSPPKHVPAELLGELDAKRSKELVTHARGAALGLSTFVLYFPMLVWIGVRDWAYIGVLYALVVATVAFTLYAGRRPRTTSYQAWVAMCATALLVAGFSRLTGPFLLPAGLAAVAMAVSATHPQLMRRPILIISIFVVAALGPWGLELAGVLERTYTVSEAGFVLTSTSLVINPVVGPIAIAGFILSVVIVIGIISVRIARMNQETRMQLEVQAWHLRQLVPAARRAQTAPV
jgi:hypothetical protein